MDRWTDRRTDKRTDGQTDERTDRGRTDRKADRRRGRQAGSQADDRRMDGWIRRQSQRHRHARRHINIQTWRWTDEQRDVGMYWQTEYNGTLQNNILYCSLYWDSQNNIDVIQTLVCITVMLNIIMLSVVRWCAVALKTGPFSQAVCVKSWQRNTLLGTGNW